MTLQEKQRKYHEKWVKVWAILTNGRTAYLKDGRFINAIEVDQSLFHLSQDVFLLKLGNEHARCYGYDLGAYYDLIDWSMHKNENPRV